MAPITSIYIPHIEEGITPEYIMDTFYQNELANISRITLIKDIMPSKYSGITYSQAFIDIGSWHETEAAYNFIQNLKDFTMETRFTHSFGQWWLVKINPKPWITSMQLFQDETTVNYFANENVCDTFLDVRVAFQFATNELGAKLIKSLSDDQDWLDIEKSLREEKNYQQLEYDLCL